MTELVHRNANLGDVRLHYVEAGAGPLVILLHGFPEFWYSWRHQLPALAGAGFRAVAPDLRGFNLSSKPAGVRAYSVERLVGDVHGLIRRLGEERATVVGHDWGGAIAWLAAMDCPALVERLAILNAPHPIRFAEGLRTLRQLRKSWYVFFFQLPWLPELATGAFDHGWGRHILETEPTRPGAFTAGDVERYVESWRRPGASTATLNYYRSLFRRWATGSGPLLQKIDCPALVIWGEDDRYLGPELAEPPNEWVPHARVERLPAVSHWVQSDAPERVNALLLEFLS